MKSAIIFRQSVVFGFLAAICVAESEPTTKEGDGGDAVEGKALFSLCPDFKVAYPGLKEKIDLKQILGPWYMIRNKCPDPARVSEVDCMRELYYTDDKAQKNSASWVMQVRNRTTSEYKTWSGVMKFKGQDSDSNDRGKDKIGNVFEFDFSEPGSKVSSKGQSALIDTDDGESWALWAVCMEMGPEEKHMGWSIYSRTPWADARVEQSLIEKIEEYGGIAERDLYGIGQTDCFKHVQN